MKFKFKIQILSLKCSLATCGEGQCRERTFPSSQKILLDGDSADHARVIILNSCARLYTHTHTLTSCPHTPFFSSYRGVKVKVVPGSMGYTVHGILQSRILKWVAFPFSRGSFQPRGQTQVSGIAGGSFPRCGGWEYEHASQCHSAVERRSSLVPTVSHTLWATRRQLWRQSMLTAF